jgi:hypothetical protein
MNAHTLFDIACNTAKSYDVAIRSQFDDGGEGLSEWLDEKQAHDEARGLEQEAFTYEESESRRKEV